MTAPPDPGLSVDEHRTTAGMDLPLHHQAAAQARRYVGQVLRTWQCDDELVHDVLLVTSELVTNAVLHGGRLCELQLEKTLALLRLEVSDGSSVLPRRREHTDDENGRGLTIIDAVAGSWGTTHRASGKTVWAQWPVPALPAPEPPLSTVRRS